MPKRLSSAEIIRTLELHGFSFVSQKGSHCKYRDASGRITIVPHPRKELPIGTTRALFGSPGCGQSNLTFNRCSPSVA